MLAAVGGVQVGDSLRRDIFNARTTSYSRRQSKLWDSSAVQAVIDATLNQKPMDATHWSVHKLADDLQVTRDFARRVWQAFGVKPHLHSFHGSYKVLANQ